MDPTEKAAAISRRERRWLYAQQPAPDPYPKGSVLVRRQPLLRSDEASVEGSFRDCYFKIRRTAVGPNGMIARAMSSNGLLAEHASSLLVLFLVDLAAGEPLFGDVEGGSARRRMTCPARGRQASAREAPRWRSPARVREPGTAVRRSSLRPATSYAVHRGIGPCPAPTPSAAPPQQPAATIGTATSFFMASSLRQVRVWKNGRLRTRSPGPALPPSAAL